MMNPRRIALHAIITLSSLTIAPSVHAADYNVIVFDDFDGRSSDVEGALAAGGDISLYGYAVGLKLGAASDGTNTLVAGKSIAFSNGQLHHGNAVAPAISGDGYLATGAKVLGSGLDFASLKRFYSDRSLFDAGRIATGSVFNQYGTMTLTGSLADLNIFEFAGADTSSVGLFNLRIPANAYALVNVTGSSASFLNMGFDVGATPASHILFNFADATSLALGGIGFEGSILAPVADVRFDNGHLDGQLIARSMSGTGQINNFVPDLRVFFGPSATAAPEPGTWLMLVVGFLSIGAIMRRRSAVILKSNQLAS